MITFENTWTMPQERYNTRWVRENGVGIVLTSIRSLAPAVADLAARLPEMQSRVKRLRNRAIFEVPAILAGLMESSRLSVARDWSDLLSEEAA